MSQDDAIPTVDGEPSGSDADSAAWPYDFGKSAWWFWLGSMVGFVAFGYGAAGVTTVYRGVFANDHRVPLVIALATGLAIGLPAALVFARVMRRKRCRTSIARKFRALSPRA